MSGIEEVIAIVGGTLIVMGSRKVLIKLGVKMSKRKLKNLLIKGFEAVDFDMMKKAILSLQDFDEKHSTKKLDKYLGKIVKKNKTINQSKLKEAVNNLDKLETIFDEDEDEVKVEQMSNLLNERLDEVDKRRREVLIRKNEIRQQNLSALKKKGRRKMGSMG